MRKLFYDIMRGSMRRIMRSIMNGIMRGYLVCREVEMQWISNNIIGMAMTTSGMSMKTRQIAIDVDEIAIKINGNERIDEIDQWSRNTE